MDRMKQKAAQKYKAGAIDTLWCIILLLVLISLSKSREKFEVHFFYTFFEESKVKWKFLT